MYCINCGKQIEDNSQFCEFCGAKQESYKRNFINKSNNKKDLSAKKIFILVSAVISLIIVSIITVIFIQNINAKKDIDYVVEQFNKDEIDYNDAVNSINDINCHDRDSLIQYKNSAISRIDELNISKNAFASAKECMESGKYDEAIPLFASVSENDFNYQDAQTYLLESKQKYLDSVYALVDKYIGNCDYDSALNLCEKAKQIIPDYSDDIDNIISEIEEEQELFYENQVKILEESAKANYDNGDYSAAINDYKNLYNMTGDNTYEVFIESVEYDWSNSVISAAEEQLAEGKYDAAIELLKEPKRSISNNSAITEEEKRINSFRPLDLTTVNPMSFGSEVDEDSWWDTYQYEEWDSDVCDNTGVYGGNGVVFAAYTYITLTDEYYSYWEKYSIKDDYDYFSCKFAISGNKESYINTELSIVLNVYCDDVLVYTSDSITGGSLPVYIEDVNVSGASTITLEIVASNNTGDQVANDRFAVGWVDPKLSKKYVPLDSVNDNNKPEENNNTVEDNMQNSNSDNDQSKTRKTPFYGIWCYGSKNEDEAVEFSKKMGEKGINSSVFVTTDWSNLNSEKYYVVTAGIYESESSANDNLNSIKSVGYSDAYVKYSGEYTGK